MRAPLPIFGSALLVLVTVACGEDGPAPDAFTVVDSAGVEIVMSTASAWGPDESWTLSDEPTLSIGEASGDQAYTLFRVTAAVRLDDDRIAVANGGTSQIRLYDLEGRHLENIGRPGAGPGEFMAVRDVWRGQGDSIVAADNGLSRLTVFDAQGALGRTIPLQQSDTPRQLFGRGTFDSGDLLVSGPLGPSEGPRTGLFDGGTREFDRYSADGIPVNPIASLPHGRRWGFEIASAPAWTAAPFEISSPPHATDGEAVFLGDGMSAEVEQRSPGGDLIRMIRWGAEPRPVTSELEDAFRDMRLEGAGEEFRSSTLAMLDGIVFPDHLPVYETLKTDTEGFLWVKSYTPDWEPGGPWWVFDETGRWLGEVDIPAELTVFEIGPDYILGMVRDEQDVERVVMYALERPDRS